MAPKEFAWICISLACCSNNVAKFHKLLLLAGSVRDKITIARHTFPMSRALLRRSSEVSRFVVQCKRSFVKRGSITLLLFCYEENIWEVTHNLRGKHTDLRCGGQQNHKESRKNTCAGHDMLLMMMISAFNIMFSRTAMAVSKSSLFRRRHGWALDGAVDGVW